ncbi:pyrimidine dimer DNA glycosylase/endonuclease V [Diaphorobacter ruginosibacter]|uniref:pyrimidine dimer DNA glycosylase/endonuclease V n=1 Tax=Diaphorobacter ruginosibacter TaxID=1715720 RepID=UPI003342A6BD
MDTVAAVRLWSLHPRHLDTRGLVALWRETLLAQAVLRGETRGYRNHPQLERFREHVSPLDAISIYLSAVHGEATARGYRFDAGRIHPPGGQAVPRLTVTDGQIEYEWKHLLGKLQVRSPQWFEQQSRRTTTPALHPLFDLEHGLMASWERPAAPKAP